MQRNIFGKLKKIIISLLTIIITMQSVCFAEFNEEQKYLLYGAAKQVAEMDTAFTISDDHALNCGYNLQATYGSYGKYSGNHIWLCCALWVSTLLKRVGVEITAHRRETNGYAMPNGWINPLFKEISEAELECGDIVLWGTVWIDGIEYYGHMGMYLGDGIVTDCSPRASEKRPHGGVYVRNYWTGTKYLRYIGDTGESQWILPPIDAIIDTIKDDWDPKTVRFREVNESSIDKNKKFEYQGLAVQESQTVTNGSDGWRFPLISDLLEWLLNFICTIIKAVFVGFATIIQVMVTYYMDAASGEDVSNRLANGMMAYFSGGGLKEDIADSVTMEKIVYNKVPLLDADVFNGMVAGGKTLSASSVVVIIRNLVAGFYMAIRKVSIIALLIVLIYYGIKFVTSGIAEQKAEYKQKLQSWAIAFFIVFGLHYFIIAVMKINEIIVNLLSQVGTNIASAVSGGEYFELATGIRELTYQTGITKSLLATVLYLVMVYYLVKFIIIYFKRLFVTVILIILGPFMGIKFAIDKIKFNKSASLSTWAKEYIFSVGTQSIHALVYTIFVGISYKMVVEMDTAKMAVCILAFMFFRFMTEAEKMLRKFLKLSGDSAKSIMGDLDTTDIKDIFGWAIITRMGRYTKSTGVSNIVARKYKTGKKFMQHQFENEYIKMRRNEYIREYNEAYMPDERGRKTKAVSNIDKNIDDLIRAEYRYKVDKAMENFGKTWGVAVGAGKLMLGIPVAVVEKPLVGSTLIYAGGSTIFKTLGGAIKGYKTAETIAKYRAKNGTYQSLQAWVDANATSAVAHELREKYLYTKDDVLAEKEAKLALLHEARKEEMIMQLEVAKQKEKLLKGADGVGNTTQLQNKLAKEYTRKLRKSVEQRMRTVDRKDIQKEVKNYMKKNNKTALTFTDFALIADKLDVKLDKDIVKGGEGIDNLLEIEQLTENIKAETMARFISEVTEQDEISKGMTLNVEVMEQVENNIKEKMETTTDESEKRTMLNAMKCIEDKRHEIEGKGNQKVYSNLDKEEQSKVKGVIQDAQNDQKEKNKKNDIKSDGKDKVNSTKQEETKEKQNTFKTLDKEEQTRVKNVIADAIDENVLEKQVTKLSPEQIVDTMKKAVNMEGSIKRETTGVEKQFSAIIKQAEKMRDINEIARERGEEPIYKNVGQLVENMIKNTKIRLDDGDNTKNT